MPVQKLTKLTPIPDKRYFKIGEVSKLCALEPHVLRYWEQEFSLLKPVKRTGRRYYQREDILLVRQIRDLLYEQGYTIEGARKHLSKDNIAPVNKTDILTSVLQELESVMTELNAAA